MGGKNIFQSTMFYMCWSRRNPGENCFLWNLVTWFELELHQHKVYNIVAKMPVGLIISAFGCFEPVMKWEKILDLATFEINTLNCQKMVRIGIAVKAAIEKKFKRYQNTYL